MFMCDSERGVPKSHGPVNDFCILVLLIHNFVNLLIQEEAMSLAKICSWDGTMILWNCLDSFRRECTWVKGHLHAYI